jgi:hypothetical protein
MYKQRNLREPQCILYKHAPVQLFSFNGTFSIKSEIIDKLAGTREISIQGEGDITVFAVVNQLRVWVFPK